MRYSQIVDGLPTPPQLLPMSFADVSNFHTLPDDTLATYGWYPYTHTWPPSYDKATERLVQNFSFDGTTVNTSWQAVPLTAEELADIAQQTIQTLGQAVKDHLNATVQARDYDSIVSACTYATSAVSSYQADGQACVNWRDAVWPYVYQVLDDVQAGTRAIPTAEELIAELPELVWP